MPLASESWFLDLIVSRSTSGSALGDDDLGVNNAYWHATFFIAENQYSHLFIFSFFHKQMSMQQLKLRELN